MHPMVQFALRAARSAAEQFVRARDRIEVARGDQQLDQLLADTARNAETLIDSQFRRSYPQHGLSGRYTAHRDGEGEGADFHWRIEPFHGYSNLAVASPNFAISVICLVKGKPEHAVIVCPFSDDEYLVSRGRGAQLNGRRIRVPNHISVEGARIAAGLPEPWLRSRHLPTYLALVQALGPQVENFLSSGSGLLDLAQLAAGRVDAAFVLGLEEQDQLVGSLLLKEAGALLGGPDGSPTVSIEQNLMAATPRLYKTLVQQLKPRM
ncbi:inositol monophosphatase family protein [Chromohalobacter beijerinckii]|uniref:Inositol monophosphatase family protein n=1 Tax=Chromohalobacter beijerinckii TaxID=86179 RepID=A0ABV8XET3_9GAMM|nr:MULTISPECIES: inositol monophosphatase family protein [Chromohalobacter]MCK0764819.1 inositol monophosphatase [Chromohalobacter beijerinckii]MCK2042504.1 inositol monophosphatase [Chromohalobacter moromii]MCT8514977.1 inositol monophosphatase [Chromohalobacter sp. TMW 2.2271]CDQ34834.1 Inositol-1-monophosphatase [Virgibacillus halodenitrificans]